jgi:hypothetical protein
MKSMNEKYPEFYFDHYLSMFCSNHNAINEDNLLGHASLYKQIEGKKNMKKLIEEIDLIERNDDWKYFIEMVARAYQVKIKVAQLKSMAKIVKKVYLTKGVGPLTQ